MKKKSRSYTLHPGCFQSVSKNFASMLRKPIHLHRIKSSIQDSIRCWKSAILLLAISLPIASCTHLYKYYYYETAVVPINAGRIEATLKGSWKKVSQGPEITENSSPYYLVIKVFIEGAPSIPVTLTSLNLDIKSRRKLILDDPEEEHTRQTIETAPPFTAYVFTGLELPEHEPVTITGHIYFGNDEVSFSTTINPDYQEEKRNNIYDGIMGI